MSSRLDQIRRIRTLALGLALAGVALGAARADITLYSTGFENPPFTAGQSVIGQGGFVLGSGSNNASLSVSTTHPFQGTQSLAGVGALLPTIVNGVVSQSAAQPIGLNPVALDLPVVVLNAHIRLDGPSTDTGTPDDDDLAHIAIEVNLSDNSYFAAFASSDGRAYGFANVTHRFSTPVALGMYHDYTMTLNFATRQVSYRLDGNDYGTVDFDPGVNSTTVKDIRITMSALTSYPGIPSDARFVDPALYNGWVDNYSLTAVPEPGSAALLGLGATAFGLGAIRRNRLRRAD